MAATPKPFFKAASHKSSYKHNGHFCASLALPPPCYWSNTIIGGEQFITSDRQKELNSAHQCEAGASSFQAKRIYIHEQPEPQTVTHCPTSIYYPSHLGCREECENYMSVIRTVLGIQAPGVRLLLERFKSWFCMNLNYSPFRSKMIGREPVMMGQQCITKKKNAARFLFLNRSDREDCGIKELTFRTQKYLLQWKISI